MVAALEASTARASISPSGIPRREYFRMLLLSLNLAIVPNIFLKSSQKYKTFTFPANFPFSPPTPPAPAPYFFPPSEGVSFPCISVSPSEGAQMGHRPENACSRVSISNMLPTPSEGEALSCISVSPSEGAQMGHRPENACSRVSISNMLPTPSEGEALSRIFRPPSKGAQMGHRPENACSRVSISNMLLTPSEGEALSRIFRPPSKGAQKQHHRHLRTPSKGVP